MVLLKCCDKSYPKKKKKKILCRPITELRKSHNRSCLEKKKKKLMYLLWHLKAP